MQTEHQKRVEEFMRKAEQDLPVKPIIPSLEIRRLRAKLILEEALETIEALGFKVLDLEYLDINDIEFHELQEPDLEKIADGCADLSVVTIGTLSACGIKDKSLLEEVDGANLRKFEIPICPVHGKPMKYSDINKWYWCELGCDSTAYGPYKREDGKWVKGPNWTPPNIKRVLKEQGEGK